MKQKAQTIDQKLNKLMQRAVAARDRAPAASGRPDSLTPESSPDGVIAQGGEGGGVYRFFGTPYAK